MDSLEERLEVGSKTLTKLEELLRLDAPTAVVRDAAIHRFNYTFEAIYKAAQEYLLTAKGIDVGSPKGVIRACREVGIFNETETRRALQMADDRNLSQYVSTELLAEALFLRIREYAPLLHLWLALLG